GAEIAPVADGQLPARRQREGQVDEGQDVQGGLQLDGPRLACPHLDRYGNPSCRRSRRRGEADADPQLALLAGTEPDLVGADPRPARDVAADGQAELDASWVEVGPGDAATVRVDLRGRPGEPFAIRAQPDAGPVAVVEGVVPAGAGRSGRRRPLRMVLPIVAVVALVAGLLATRGDGSGTDSEDDLGLGAQQPASANCPVAGHLAPDPAGLPRRNVPFPDGYSFLETQPGGCQPVRFNPCEPVHYVVNSALAPPGALADLTAAFAQLSEATGIEFVDDGPTDEPASLSRRPFQPERYGNRWAPVLVVWANGGPLRLDESNPGGGRAINGGGVYISGILILNVDAVTDERRRTPLESGFGAGATWGRVMIHELGHLVGLGHVRTSQEIMFDELGLQTGRAEYHRGDREGLRLLGRDAGCLTTPRAPGAPR
ncbi:MAG TPA: matrixin family metalloprotease, partial [Acidimicrobiales bacterium]